MRKILVAIGSASEAIRIAPLLRRFQSLHHVQTVVFFEVEHRQLLGQALGILGVAESGRMRLETSLEESSGLDRLVERYQPDYLVSFSNGVTGEASLLGSAAGQVEASLRICRLSQPCRKVKSGSKIDTMATYHLVPSSPAYDQLPNAGVAERVFAVDSLSVDALLMAVERMRSEDGLKARLAAALHFLDPHKRLIFVAGLRQEREDARMRNLCRALKRLAMRPDAQVICLAQPGSAMARALVEECAGPARIALIPPQEYLHLAYLMQAAHLIIADTGAGLNALLPLDKPVLVLRDAAELRHVADAGNVSLVGMDAERILSECPLFLDDPSHYRASARLSSRSRSDQVWRQVVEDLLR